MNESATRRGVVVLVGRNALAVFLFWSACHGDKGHKERRVFFFVLMDVVSKVFSLSLVWRAFWAPFNSFRDSHAKEKKKISQNYTQVTFIIINTRARPNKNQTRVLFCEEKKELFSFEKRGEILSPFDFAERIANTRYALREDALLFTQ